MKQEVEVGARRHQIIGVCLCAEWASVQTLAVILTYANGGPAVCIDIAAKHDIFTDLVEPLFESLENFFFPSFPQNTLPRCDSLEKGLFSAAADAWWEMFCLAVPPGCQSMKKKVQERGKTQEPISLHELFSTEWPLLRRADGEVC